MPVAHDRIENFVIGHAVAFAGGKIVHAVGGRGMDDAGAGVKGHIVAQIHGGDTIVKRMLEGDAFQRLPFCRGDNFSLKGIIREALRNELFRKHQRAAQRRHQRISKLAVNV